MQWLRHTCGRGTTLVNLDHVISIWVEDRSDSGCPTRVHLRLMDGSTSTLSGDSIVEVVNEKDEMDFQLTGIER